MCVYIHRCLPSQVGSAALFYFKDAVTWIFVYLNQLSKTNDMVVLFILSVCK